MTPTKYRELITRKAEDIDEQVNAGSQTPPR